MSYLDNLKEATNFGLTENGGIKHLTSNSGLMDLFGLGGAYRKRTEADVIALFKKAFDEEPEDAIRCLFYLRDRSEGQGERRFFRVILSYLASENPKVAKQLIRWVPFYGRWDDLYAMVDGSPDVAMYVWRFIQDQLVLDLKSETPSLLAKWLKSENATSRETKRLATATRSALGLSSKQYRQTLSYLREKINIVERLMSENRWDEIRFDKIPSAAGFRYRNAFARRDIIKEKYKQFARDTETKVNAGTLYPYEVVAKAFKYTHDRYPRWAEAAAKDLQSTERLMINKYWDNLKDYFDGSTLDALCVVDTSGSMWGDEASAPINVAISLGLYAAERARGPFAHHYISFSSRPQLIETNGIDFVDKVFRIYKTNLCENTNIKATFDMLLRVAQMNHCKQEDCRSLLSLFPIWNLTFVLIVVPITLV